MTDNVPPPVEGGMPVRTRQIRIEQPPHNSVMLEARPRGDGHPINSLAVADPQKMWVLDAANPSVACTG